MTDSKPAHVVSTDGHQPVQQPTQPLAEPDQKFAEGTTNSAAGSDNDDAESGYGSTRDHVFSDPKVAEYWRDVYEKSHYENRHRFDPDFTWTAVEEKKVKRKIDFSIMTWAWMMFVALELNRRNINRGQCQTQSVAETYLPASTITDNMLPELNMNTNDFNYGQTIFLVSFLSAELPSGLISKKLGPDIWIPFIITAWSIVSASQAGLKSKTRYYVVRCLLGLLMGGFIPDTVLYITYWYKAKELPIRLSWFWTVLSVCNIVGAFLAAGILQMRGVAGWSGWQWLFLIEGGSTFLIGVASWFLLPASPSQTAGWLRSKKGWFSEHEEKILVNRLLRDDPSKGDMNNRQAVGPLGLTAYIPVNPPGNYLAFILRQIGFSTFQANLLTIPSQFIYGINLLIISRISEWVNERSLVSSSSQIWIFPFLVALVALGKSASAWLRYGLLTGLLSYPYCHAILVAWNSRNSNNVRTRAVSAALYNMFVQSGNIIRSNIYRDDDRPYYVRGNKILLGLNV